MFWVWTLAYSYRRTSKAIVEIWTRNNVTPTQPLEFMTWAGSRQFDSANHQTINLKKSRFKWVGDGRTLVMRERSKPHCIAWLKCYYNVRSLARSRKIEESRGFRAINFDCARKSCASWSPESLHRARVEGKLLHRVIISLHDRMSNANRKFTRCLMIPDNTHRS